MKMVILGGGCFEPSLIRLQHGLNQNQLYKRWKINTLKKLVNDIEMSQAWSIAYEDMADLCLQTKRFRFE